MEGQKLRATRGQIGQYLLTERIGAGSFAVVYKAKHVSRGHVVAIKEIVTDWLHEKLIQGLYSEIQILQKISHPNIVRLHDIISVRVSPYCSPACLHCDGVPCSTFASRVVGLSPCHSVCISSSLPSSCEYYTSSSQGTARLAL